MSDVLDLPTKCRGYVALPAVGQPMQTKDKAARGDSCHLGNKKASGEGAKAPSWAPMDISSEAVAAAAAAPGGLISPGREKVPRL